MLHGGRKRGRAPGAATAVRNAVILGNALNMRTSVCCVTNAITCCVFLLQDTRTHVVVELYDTERSYVESLQILVTVSSHFNRNYRIQKRKILPEIFGAT